MSPASTVQPIRSAGRGLLLVACLLFLLIPSAGAAPDALDPTFGAGGKVTTKIGSSNDFAYALVRQPDGRLVAAGTSTNGVTLGDFALARYKPDGSLDTSFNGTGKVTTAIGPSWDLANALVLQPDGKLVAAGCSDNGSDFDVALARYNSNGSLDTSFNGTGKVTTAFGSGYDCAYALVLQPDGKLVVAGRASNGLDDDFALARYKPDGSLDTTFNGTGKVTTAIGPGGDAVSDLALQPDGKIVAAGHSYTNANGYSQDVFALARYNANGSLDTGFGSGGKVTTAIGTWDDANALVLQPDGKLVAAGIGHVGSAWPFALARYKPDGSLDTSFNGTGKVTTAIGSNMDDAIALELRPDGKLVAAGYSNNGGSDDDFALARYNPNGTLDPGFGSGGKLTSPIGSGKDDAYALALQPDGKVVAAGVSWNGSDADFALARYLGSTLTVAKAGGGSGTVMSSPNGIACGSTCAAAFAAVPVTLTATAAPGSTFAGWSGDCSGTGTCTLTMGAGHWVTARFEADKTLTLTTAGKGTITSSPAGIDCGSSCVHAFRHGTSVTLTAKAAAGSSFAGWSGDCSGTGGCTLTMSSSHSAAATFKPVCIVPKLKGKTLAAGKKALRRAHCATGKVTRAFSANVKKGRVISQKPKRGKRLAAGSRIKLKVSKGKRG